MSSESRSRYCAPSIARIFVFVLALTIPPGLAFGQAELPRVYLDTAYSPPTSGQVITVNAGDDFQAALDQAQPGDIIELEAGATFTGSFTLRNKTGAGWIYIRPTPGTQLPSPGTRVIPCSAPAPPVPCNASAMPTIQAVDDRPAIVTEPGVHHYRFVGIEFSSAAGIVVDNLILLGAGLELLETALPHDIVIDRCYVHGEPNVAAKRGVALNSRATAVIDSYLADFKRFDTDLEAAESQAIAGWNGPGPFKIANNYIEGAGENLLFGGADPTVPNLVPSDIDIRGNYFYKPPAWKGRWTVRHLFELKNARRVLIEGNVFQNNWEDSDHTGAAIAFTVRNQGGTAPWATVTDVTFRHNIVRCSGGGFGIHGSDDRPLRPSQPSERLVVRDNVLEDITSNSPPGDPDCSVASGTGRLYQIVTREPAAPNFVTIDHNTGFADAALLFALGVPGTAEGFVYTNNVAPMGRDGVTGLSSSGTTGEGSPTLDTFFPGHVFTRNVIQREDADCTSYPPGNACPATWADVRFVDQASGNYRLAPDSPYKNLGTDGRDIGAAIDAIDVMTAAAVSGASNPPTPVRESVVWTDLVNVTADGNSLRKTSGCDGCEDAGAISLQEITVWGGYVEFTASENGTLRAAGLGQGITDTAEAEIEFGVKLWQLFADVRESGVCPGEPDDCANTTYTTGDVFRVAVESDVVRYYKNGALLYESLRWPSYPLRVDTALLNLNSTISNAVMLRYR